MTNNDINAWNTPRPVATYQNHNWDQHFEDFGSNENFPLYAPYSGYFQDSGSQVNSQDFNFAKTPSYVPVFQNQYQLTKQPSAPQQIYHEPVPASSMSCLERQSPMLGDDNSWGYGRRNGSFAEFVNTKNGLKGFSSLSSTDSELTPFASALSLGPQQTLYQGESSGDANCLDANRNSPSTVYSSYSSSGPSVDPLSMGCASMSTSPDSPAKGSWWPETSDSNKEQYQNFRGQASHHGLPLSSSQYHNQRYGDIRGAETNTWASANPPVAPATISPTALTLQMHQSASQSSFDSSHGLQQLLVSLSPTPSSSSNSEDASFDYSDFETPEALNVIVPKTTIHRPRQILPDSIPLRKRFVPVPSNNSFPGNAAARKRSLRSSDNCHPGKASSRSSGKDRSFTKSAKLNEQEPSQPSAPKRIEPKPASSPAQQLWASGAQSTEVVQAMHHRDSKDEFLVKSKLAGMPYKEIRRQGNFTEAESTLRGRFRTLTKHKTQRVRKPEWNDNDIRLLKKAVRKLTPGSDLSRSKIPWKQVAEYIADNGGSYHFGNATCRKRWDELQARR